MHLWTVVRVLQHTTPAQSSKDKEADADQLNLSSDNSLSAASAEDEDVEGGSEYDDDRSTLEMSDFKQLTRDPVPDGYLRRPETH